ncbi:MAG: hypothetical protein ABJJ48_00460, partial [Marinomonas sp.]
HAAARELVAEDGVAQPAGDHPDILTLTHLPKDDKEERKREKGEPYEKKRNITVGQIRGMQQRLTTRPTLGARRAIIIDPSDDMEKSASNALLKSLEEPPQGTFFLLVSHRPARLLPTIRSRCRMVRFPVLDEAMLRQFLSDDAPEADPASVDAAIAACGGSPGIASAFIEHNLTGIAAILSAIVAKGDHTLGQRASLVKALGQRPNRAKIAAVLGLAQSTLTHRIADRPAKAQLAAIEANRELGILAGQAATYNFDTGLLIMEAAGLLARAGQASD